MNELENRFRTINKILSLVNPKDKELILRLKKELFQIKKSLSLPTEPENGLNDQENDLEPLENNDAISASKTSSTNLYGESNNTLEETSGAAGGAVAGHANGGWLPGPLTEEEDILGYIESVFAENKFINAFLIREKVKSIVKEAEGSTVKVNKLTGMNKLEKFLKQNIKSIKEAYMDLTTDKNQRASFKAHLLKLLSELLETLFVNVEAESRPDPLQEANNINFEIDTHNGEDGKIIDVDGDGKPDEKFQTIEGMDETGKKEAVQVYNKLEKQIGDPDSGIFANLSNELDRKVFAKWLLINLSKHMDKWESLFQELDSEETDISENNPLDQV